MTGPPAGGVAFPDLLPIAGYGAAGAVAAGLAGALVLRAVRRRPVAVSLAVLTTVAVGATLAGTLAVARSMFLSRHDLAVVTAVAAVAAVAASVTALLLGRWVSSGHRALEQAARTLGDGGGFTAPVTAMPAELTSLARQLADTDARLADARQRERSLEASRRTLVAWISHDLRAPLSGLRAMAEALEDGVAPEPARYHRQIRSEVDRLGTMIEDLFELSRIQAGSLSLAPAPVSAYDLLGDAVAGAEPLAAERGVRLADGGADAVPMLVDGKEMSRVLTNLLVNAIRRTPPGGTVRVAAARRDEGTVLSVTDGCGGIPPGDLPRVFETGWRGAHGGSPDGTGLGLAIVRGIVEAHGGLVRVGNVPGGCCFEVVLPVPEDVRAPATAVLPAPARRPAGLRRCRPGDRQPVRGGGTARTAG
ncbi:HAMP domain-containing sensor histidine kinase [Streptomyces sodiiphilus]|uniref:histidine kinase n=1 Tax=Streptomyces sodiiphilus TaxID=226217 RepID=A0ABP5ATN9_9ACTN